jgi:hypothetical protein
MNGNGRPRVGGSPYDTAHVQQLLSRMQKDPAGTAETESVRALSSPPSGFFDRLVADYFTHGSIPVRLKDVGKAMFGVPTEENTQTWGDSTDQLSFTSPDAEVVGTTSKLALHINRTRPTTFTLLTVVNFTGTAWSIEGPADITISYTIGVGMTHATILKTFHVATPLAPFMQAALDITTAPLQSLVASVKLDATNNNVNQPHGVVVTMLAAPVVQ